MEKEEEEEKLFIEWSTDNHEQESAEEPDEDEDKDRSRMKSGLDITKPSQLPAKRRASLPCPAKLNAMQLTHLTLLHNATMAPCSVRHRLEKTKSRQSLQSFYSQNKEVKDGTSCERQLFAVSTSATLLQNRRSFRGRNVMSLSDADSTCLICHDDLRRGGGSIQKLHCSHSFHSECIENWMWMKQTCPTCHKHLAMPEPSYWTSIHLKVP